VQQHLLTPSASESASIPSMIPTWADPYPFFAEAQTATPVFYSPLLDYWVVTRYHDMRQVFQTPQLFSAVMRRRPACWATPSASC
jgi:cytochrome P450